MATSLEVLGLNLKGRGTSRDVGSSSKASGIPAQAVDM